MLNKDLFVQSLSTCQAHSCVLVTQCEVTRAARPSLCGGLSNVSSVGGLGPLDSPPQATSPTVEVRQLILKINQLPNQVNISSCVICNVCIFHFLFLTTVLYIFALFLFAYRVLAMVVTAALNCTCHSVEADIGWAVQHQQHLLHVSHQLMHSLQVKAAHYFNLTKTPCSKVFLLIF